MKKLSEVIASIRSASHSYIIHGDDDFEDSISSHLREIALYDQSRHTILSEDFDYSALQQHVETVFSNLALQFFEDDFIKALQAYKRSNGSVVLVSIDDYENDIFDEKDDDTVIVKEVSVDNIESYSNESSIYEYIHDPAAILERLRQHSQNLN